MNAREFLDKHGKERCGEVAKASGITMGYFLQIVYGYRTPSFKLARRLIEASANELDIDGLANPPQPTRKMKTTK